MINIDSIDLTINNIEIKKLLTNDPRFNIHESQYSFRLFDKKTNEPLKKINLPFDSNYGIILKFQNEEKTFDVAALGFNIEEELLCNSIRGGKKMYKPLSGVYWDSLLLKEAIHVGNQLGIPVACLPSYRVEEYTCALADKLQKRYDANAKKNGFLFSEEKEFFIREFKNKI